MFLSRENDIKLCQNYTKIHIYTILYTSSRFKQIIFSKYATNLKTSMSQEPEYLRFALFIIFNFYFAVLIDKIDNIITYSPYNPYYFTRNLANGSAVYWSRDTDGNHVTSILHCHWLKFW